MVTHGGRATALHRFSRTQRTLPTVNATLKQALAAAALLGAFAAPASAIGTGSLLLDVQSAVSDGRVNVTVSDGVATLTGDADSVSRAAAARAALADPSVTRVVNLVDAS